MNGLGILPLNLLSMAFSGKLWWLFRTKNSIWSAFMRAKYGDPIHILAHPPFSKVTDSHTWPRMLSVMDNSEPYIVVCFRSSTSFFLCENLDPMRESLWIMLWFGFF